MTTPRISVCVPTYNGESYLNDCLESIARQTFADVEVLVVDDGSTDESVKIARDWAARDSRFRVHQNERNLGLVPNWNRCIALARGEWIKLLFQDDLMEEACLSALLQAGESGSGFVACARRLVFEDSVSSEAVAWYRNHSDWMAAMFGGTGHLSAESYTAFRIKNLGLNIVGEPSTTLIRRDLFDRFGLFDPLLVQLCDSEMWDRLGTNVGVDYVADELAAFRIHRLSASEANRKRQFRADVIDRLVELNRLCEAPQLDRFRRTARRLGELGRLRRLWLRQAWGAVREASRAVRRQPPDTSLTTELQAVLDQLTGRSATLAAWFNRMMTPRAAR